MPKVSNMAVRIDGEYQRFDIHYNKDKSFHIKDFPNRVSSLSENSLLSHFSTEKDLVKAVREIVDVYHNKCKASRKVIIIYMSATTEVKMVKTGEGHWSGDKDWVTENLSSMNGGGWGFSIDYQIAMEINSNGLEYYRIREDGDLGYRFTITSERVIVEYTEQREKCLKDVCTSMEKLAEKVSKVLLNEKQVIKFMDSGSNLLN